MEKASLSIIQNLAPNDLMIRRATRFDGSGMSVSLSDFEALDRCLIQQIYHEVHAVYQTWLHNQKDCTDKKLAEQVCALKRDDFFSTVHSLGTDTLQNKDEAVSKQLGRALHDIKGGSLNSLLGFAQLISEQNTKKSLIQRAVNMARDHAKIMRNVLPDLDPKIREDDESDCVHHIKHFVDKLMGFNFEFQELKLSIALHCSYDGNISNRCLETSSIDRILYNFINNSAKYSANHEANVYIFPVNEFMIRWVFENPVSESHLQWFDENTEENMWNLFLANKTYKGQGIGFYTCADIVSNSIGIVSAEQTVKQGYIGAHLEGGHFFSWFHWPVLQIG